VESGIMLPANPFVSFLIKAAIVKAQGHHPIKISHAIVNGTHLHMISRVVNPEDIPGFMERFKTESAHYLNRALGRKKRTIWCSGYDSPCLRNKEDVMAKIVYLYTNPVKDGMIDSINHYPGISTWDKYRNRTSLLRGAFIARDAVFQVDQNQGYDFYQRSRRLLLKSASKPKVIDIEPDDWMKSFRIENAEEINQEIFEMIKEREQEIQKSFMEEKKTPMGATKLLNQGIRLDYEPKRSGRKMWCISSDREARKSYINFVKNLASEAYDVYQSWIRGDTARRMPAGMFAPRMPVLSNLIFVD
jgi:REP element-mobilizing transposase RayT